MRFLPLLGKKLKDNEIIEILEGLDMHVVYDFDRLHEGQPDKYWAAAKQEGFQFRFDEIQTLDVVFLYVEPSGDYAAMSRHDCDIPLFTTVEEAQRFGQAQHLVVTEGSADFLGVRREWVRLVFATHSAHYEFHGARLALVTLAIKPWAIDWKWDSSWYRQPQFFGA
jgi:hypothetical protein